MSQIILFILTAMYSYGYTVPDLPTIESCMTSQVTMNDKNWRMVISYYRACRNLGLSMEDVLPKNYMAKLAQQLRSSNYGFLRNTSLSKLKVREVEREINELFQEVTILAAKKRYCTTTKCPTTTSCRPTTETPLPHSRSSDPELIDVDPFDYDYDTGMNPFSPASLYLYLILITVTTLLVSLCICRYVYKIYKYVEIPPNEEDDEASTNFMNTSEIKDRKS